MPHSKEYPVPAEFFISHYLSERPVDWVKIFQRQAPLELEIGFGLGDFLIRSARADPGSNHVGIECDWPRVNKALRKIARVNAAAGPERRLKNIRILQIDAHLALERLFEARSIARIVCLFPCPWPKKRHAKHRLFSTEFLRLANSRMAPQGELRVVTDFLPYRDWIIEQNRRTGLDLETRAVRPQYGTKYENKWLAAGQKEFYEIYFQKKRHVRIPLKKDVPLKKYYLPSFNADTFRFRDLQGEVSVVFKDFIFDGKRDKGLLHLIVAEENLVQHVWIGIYRVRRGWEIAVVEGQTVLATEGVSRALAEVARQINEGVT